jgi:hypothetical protein
MFEVEGKRVASLFCFEDKTETLIYNSGYDPQYAYLSVGLLSKAACLRHAIEDGRQHLDFLRGTAVQMTWADRTYGCTAALSTRPESG